MPAHNRFTHLHRTVNGVHERQCSICHRWLPFTHKYFNRNTGGYLHGQCRECAKIKAQAWYADPTNKERAKLRERKKYQEKGKTNYHYKRKQLHTHRGIAKAIGNGTSPDLVLQRVISGWGKPNG